MKKKTMDFEEFKEFMRRSAAEHDARMAQVQELLRNLDTTLQRLMAEGKGTEEACEDWPTRRKGENQVIRQNRIDEISRNNAIIRQELKELRWIVFRDGADPNAYRPPR